LNLIGAKVVDSKLPVGVSIEDVGPTPIGESLIGLLVAAFIVLGEWSPARLSDAGVVALWQQPRLWIALVMLLVAISLAKQALPRNVDRPFVVVRRWYIAIGLMHFFYTGLSIAWAPNIGDAQIKLGEVAIVATVFLALAIMVESPASVGVHDATWRAMLFLTLMLAGLALPAMFAGDRVAVLGGGPNVFGRMMGVLFVGALHYLKCRRMWPFWFGVAYLAAALVVLSGSRGAMLAVTIVGILFLWCYRKRWKAIVAHAIVAIGVAAMLLFMTRAGELIRGVFSQRVLMLALEKQYSSGRDLIYQLALDLGCDKPILGAGLGGFHETYPSIAHPHNMFLESFSEGGIVGLFTLTIMMALAVGLAWLASRRSDRRFVLVFVLFLVASQFSGDFYDARAVYVLPLLFAHSGLHTPLR
jgi:O-antigen ligase